MIRATWYDAIVSDYQMAGVTGLDLLKIIRKESPDLPFLIFTGRGREQVAIEAFEHGVDFYVQKGGDPKAQFAELAHKIEKAVENRRVRRQLQETEERLGSFIRNFEGIAFQTTPEGKILFLEGRVDAIAAYNREDFLTGKITLGSLVHPDDLPWFRDEMARLATVPGTRVDSPFRIVRRDGSTRWLHGIIHNISPPGGGVLTVQGSLYDITELKSAQDEIARTEAKWRAIITRAPAFISILDRQGRILYINKAHPPNTPSSLPGTPAYRILAPDQEAELLAALDRVFSIGEVMRFESDVRLGGAVTEWLAHQISPVTWDNDEAAALVVSVVITERKWLEQNLRESEENYRAIVSASSDGIAILDPQFSIVFATPRLHDLLGIPRDGGLAGHPILAFVDIPAQDTARSRIAAVLAGDSEVEPVELPFRKADGTVFRAELVPSPLRDDNGEITGLLVLLRGKSVCEPVR